MMLTLSPSWGDKGSWSWALADISISCFIIIRYFEPVWFMHPKLVKKTIRRVHCPFPLAFLDRLCLALNKIPVTHDHAIVQAMVTQTISHRSPPNFYFPSPSDRISCTTNCIKNYKSIDPSISSKTKNSHFISVFLCF